MNSRPFLSLLFAVLLVGVLFCVEAQAQYYTSCQPVCCPPPTCCQPCYQPCYQPMPVVTTSCNQVVYQPGCYTLAHADGWRTYHFPILMVCDDDCLVNCTGTPKECEDKCCRDCGCY